MIRVLLIGGTGKLGKQILKNLLAHNYETALLVRKMYELYDDDPVNYFQGDITDLASLLEPVSWADIVINASGYVSYRRKDKDKLFEVNVKGTENIVKACEQYQKKLIHTSSVVVYGSTEMPVSLKEESHPENSYKSGYAISKAEGEKIVAEASIKKLILRPCSLISDNKSTIKNLYRFYKKGLVAGLKGGASFALMEDAAKAYIPAIDLLLKTDSYQPLVFNLGGANLAISEVFDTFKSLDKRNTIFLPNSVMYLLSKLNDAIYYPVFRSSLITYENYQTGNHFTFVDSSKAEKELGYKVTPIETSVRKVM